MCIAKMYCSNRGKNNGTNYYKSSKFGKEQKTLRFNFTYFLPVMTKTLFLEERLGTGALGSVSI